MIKHGINNRLENKTRLFLYGKKRKKFKKPKKVSVWKKQYLEYLGSEEWKNKKKEFLSFLKSGGCPIQCDICGEKKRLQVHHLSYENIFNEDIYDLQLLCVNCHRKAHSLCINFKKQT